MSTGLPHFVTMESVAALKLDAQRSARKRAHMLLHESHSDQVQRLVVAIAERSYVQPHRHAEQWEMTVPLQEAVRLLTFSDAGEVTGCFDLSPDTKPCVHVPAGQWHTLISPDPMAVFLEVKPGPYRAAEFAGWSPPEGSPAVAQFMDRLLNAKAGDLLGSH